jgi:glucose-1-phosphate thymidylyltransferase
MENSKNRPSRVQEIIGLVPAGGQATRIAPLPCSKELYPIGFRSVSGGESVRPKVVCHYLLEKMQMAGVAKAYIVLREGKWDIPAYLNDGTMLGMHLAYLMMRLPFGAPYTLDQAYPFVQNAIIAFGFPDVIFQPKDAFVQLLDRQAATKVDIVLGLFPTDQPHKVDMVDFDDHGRVSRIDIKPLQTDLHYTWMIAIWTPVFTSFMHEYLVNTIQEANKKSSINTLGQREIFIGDVIQAAIDNGFLVDSVLFPDGVCLDIGTPENLVKAVQKMSGNINATQ